MRSERDPVSENLFFPSTRRWTLVNKIGSVRHVVHTPTNALFINLVKSFKFTLKYTIISLLHVSVFNDHHQRSLSVPNQSYITLVRYG